MFLLGPNILANQRWQLLIPASGSVNTSTNYNLTSDAAFIQPGLGVFLGVVDAGAPDPAQPVRISGSVDFKATLNVVGAVRVEGGRTPAVNLGAVHVQPGGDLALSLGVNLESTVDLGGGSIDFDQQSGHRSTLRFDAAGANVSVNESPLAGPDYFVHLVARDFRAGDTITVQSSTAPKFVNTGGSTWTLGPAFTVDFTGPTAAGATYAAAPGPDGTTVITTTAQPAAAVGFIDGVTGLTGSHGMDAVASNDPSGLQWSYIETGSDSMAFATTVPNVIIGGGTGPRAMQATEGRNVLDAGTGSAFMVAGHGTDTFFADLRGTEPFWDTIVGFHPGDAITLWGWQPGVNTMTIDPNAGALLWNGATMRFHDGSGSIVGSITFTDAAASTISQYQLATGTQAAGSYLYIYNGFPAYGYASITT